MGESLDSGSNVHYLAQNKTDYFEEKLLEYLRKTREDSTGRELLDHVHNIRGKALDSLFYDFINAVRLRLPQRYQPLLGPINSFLGLNKLAVSLRNDSSFLTALREASKPFCDNYTIEVDFWMQSVALEDINTNRNEAVPCSVATSAAALSAAIDNPDACPALEHVLAMVEALTNYGEKHAEELDATAEEQRKKKLALTAQVKQRRRGKLA